MENNTTSLVFIHGGQHTGACWELTISQIRQMDPERRLLAVDLPGRRGEPGDLSTLSVEQCVSSVVRQIEEFGATDVVLVGHSMAGITLPGVITRLGAQRVKRAIYIACCIPPQGFNVTSTLRPPVSWFTGALARFVKVSRPLPGSVATWMFANGMSVDLQRRVVAGLVPDSAVLTREKVDRSAMPKIPTTWIITLRDNSLKPARQREFIKNLGNVDEVLEIDTCHNVMISEPQKLAELLIARC